MGPRADLWTVLVLCLVCVGACRPAPAVKTTAAPAESIKVEITSRKGTWTAVYGAEGKECDRRLVMPAGSPLAVTIGGSHGTQRMCVQDLGLDQPITAAAPFSFWVQLTEPKRHPLGKGCPEGPETLEGTFHVVEASDWEAWLRSGDCAPLDPAAEDYGERLFNRLGCSACHAMDGSRGVGPPLDGLMGREESLVDGSTVVVDEAYIREAILRPSAQVVRGYAPTMPDLGESLSS
ncbi:MAG: hypothetical protein VX938_13690, partial [Myxococcota bacterium]|nr:hypothetical protein [Myxococcota bacterium]